MNFVKDNTVKNPSTIIVKMTGDKYLVPPSGAAGLWTGREDQIATWGGVAWSFFAPTTGAEYQVENGPNAGRVFVRTAVSSSLISVVPNGNLQEDTSGFAAWLLTETAGGTADYIDVLNKINLKSTTTGDAAEAKVTFPLVAGMKYRIVFDTDADIYTAPDSAVTYLVRNVVGAADVASGTMSGGGSIPEVVFTAANTGNYAISVKVQSTGAEVAEISVLSLNCYRFPEMVTNGNFTNDFTDWTAPAPPWDIDTGGSAPFSGKTAFATIDYPGHTPTPALEQTIGPLQTATIYRLAFDASAIHANTLVSVAVDSALNLDLEEDGSFEFYFRSSGTSHTLSFPLTQLSGIDVGEVRLDNISIIAALWAPQPSLQVSFPVSVGFTCGTAKGKKLAASFPASVGFTCGLGRTRSSGAIAFPASTGFSCALSKVQIKELKADFPLSIGLVFKPGAVKNLPSIKFPVAIGLKFQPVDNGYYTAAMAVDAITELWSSGSCSCECDGCGPLQKAALECLNAAMQRLNASGREWGFVSNVTFNLGPKTSTDGEITLPKNIISVRRVVFQPSINDLETVFGSFTLRPVRSRHELEAFRLSSDRLAWPLSPAEAALAPYVLPVAYFTEAEDLQNGAATGPPNLRLMFGPIFSALRAYKVEVQAHIQPPRMTCASLSDGSILPVPHRFAETLLVPLAKYYALSSRWFRRDDLREAVQLQARDALLLTGEIQPAAVEAGQEAKGGRDS